MHGKPAIGPSFNAHHAVEDKAKWTEVIGKFMVAFNGIEQVVDMCIASFGSVNLYRATVDLPLNQRVKIVKALTADRKPAPDLAKRCDAAFDAIEKLANDRNVIAHNAPVTSIYMDKDKNIELRVEVRSRRSTKKLMTIDGLTRSAEASSKLAMDILGLMTEITGSSPWIPKEASAVFDGSALDAKE